MYYTENLEIPFQGRLLTSSLQNLHNSDLSNGPGNNGDQEAYWEQKKILVPLWFFHDLKLFCTKLFYYE